jgi:hypothetical protein
MESRGETLARRCKTSDQLESGLKDFKDWPRRSLIENGGRKNKRWGEILVVLSLSKLCFCFLL